MNIGDVFGGGIVVHIYEDGQTLLISSIQDVSTSITWGSPSPNTGAVSSADGKSNTAAIVATFGTSRADYAALLCDNLSQNGYSDWWLPSSDEATFISQAYGYFKASTSDQYWTSTEGAVPNDIDAISFILATGFKILSAKVSTYAIKAVRKANINDIELPYTSLGYQSAPSIPFQTVNGQINPVMTDLMELRVNGTDWKSKDQYILTLPLVDGVYVFEVRYKSKTGFNAGAIQRQELTIGNLGGSTGGGTAPPTTPATDGMTDATTALRTAYIKLLAPLIVNNITIPVYANEVNDTVSPYDRNNPPQAYITISNQNFVENSIKQKFINTHSIEVDVWTYYPTYNGDSEFCEAINSAVLSRIRSTTWGALQVDGYHCYQGAVSLSRQQNEITGTSNIYRRITIFTHQIEEI